jgi:hypothetical protein
MKTQQTAGVLLTSSKITNCSICGAQVVLARDDRWPESKVFDLISVEPNPASTNEGVIVLWYQVTEKGKPVGEQWFRMIPETSDYTGDRWSPHRETCGKIMKVDDVRSL